MSGSDVDSVGSAADQEVEKKYEDIRNQDVVTKINLASQVCNQALALVVEGAVDGASIFDLCVASDKLIVETAEKLYPGRAEKGVGYPTCIAVNNVAGGLSPLSDDAGSLKAGDVVKVDLGVQIDGYLAQVAHTIIVPGHEETPATGKRANVVAACYTAADAVMRMFRPGVSNTELSAVIAAVAKDYDVRAVDSVASYRMGRYEIEGDKRFDNGVPETPRTGDDKTKEAELSAHEVWGVDIAFSSGTGRLQSFDERTTVFKRAAEATYKLKMKTSRALYQEITKKHPHFPFSVRALEFDPKKISFGTRECSSHGLIEPYPVLRERDDEFVANVKFTVMLFPTKAVKTTGMPIDIDGKVLKPDFKPKSENVLAALSTGILGKKKRKKKNKKKKAAAAE